MPRAGAQELEPVGKRHTGAGVDAVLVEAEKAGATIGRTGAETTFWGGYSGLFIDPDGHPWEIAHNPGGC